MKVGVYYNNNDVRVEERLRPAIGPGEILVKVMASGICGTDAMEWYRTKKGPRVLGHEIAGDIAETGEGVTNFKPGDRVFVSHHVPCNSCKYCADGNQTACETLHTGNYDPGGFAEFVRVPAINVKNGTYHLPATVSYSEGVMIEPLACVLRGQSVAGIRKGQTVLILGSGVSGLMNIEIARMKGARIIATDINPYRLQRAAQFGADEVFDAARLPADLIAERIIVCAGSMTVTEQAFRHIDRKGIILLFAIPDRDISIPTTDFWRNELTVMSSYGAGPADLEESLSLISNKIVDMERYVTHRLPLDEIQKGFGLVAGAADSLKVVLLPHKEN